VKGCPILEVRVSDPSDDAEEKSTGYVGLGSGDLELVNDGNDQIIGLRFTGINIPQGAFITDAFVQFQVDEISSIETFLSIEGESIDDAPAFISSHGNISSRIRTSANISWIPVPWTTVGDVGPAQQSPDISSIIQEIVSQSTWSEGNALVLIFTGSGKRVAESYNGSKTGAPLLHIQFCAD